MKSYENVIYNRLQHALENDDNNSYDDFTGNNYAYRQKTGVQDAYREFEDILASCSVNRPRIRFRHSGMEIHIRNIRKNEYT